MKETAVANLELNLISLTSSSGTMEEKARKIREILAEYRMDIEMAKYISYRDGHSDGYHDGYFGGYNEGLAEGVGEEWQEIE